ncbi:MAG: alpha/beta hydrolase [Proteobacteria bacterium]|nr:alpha/beta hydrolase [Pseudomonadota bacterium]
METHEITSPVDGISLFVRTWMPPEGTTLKGIVQFNHGLGEHGGRYERMAGVVTAEGFVAVAADHRGHGRSGGLRGHTEGFEQFAQDVAAVMADAKAKHGDLPVYQYGHSMGGIITVLGNLIASTGAAGLIISNPSLGVAFDPPRLKVAAGRLLAKLLPRLRLDNELKVEQISRDPEEVEKYKNDPLVHRLISTRWFTSFEAAQEACKGRGKDFPGPSLWLLSTKDAICDHTKSLAFAADAPNADVVKFEGAFHEPHNDLCREELEQAVTAWLGNVTQQAETVRYDEAAEA